MEMAKRRRVTSGRKAALALTLDALTAEQESSDLGLQIRWLVNHVRQDPPLLKTLKAAVLARSKVSMVKLVPRGVRTLGDIPGHLCTAVLTALTGEDESIFTNKNDADNLTTIIWALGGNKKFRIPNLGLLVCEFVEWVHKFSKGFPARDLSKFQWGSDGADLDWKIGALSFHRTEERGDTKADTVVGKIIDNETQEVATLPARLKPLFEEIGDAWILANNYCREECVLQSQVDRRQMFLASLFVQAVGLGARARTRRGRGLVCAAPAGPRDGQGLGTGVDDHVHMSIDAALQHEEVEDECAEGTGEVHKGDQVKVHPKIAVSAAPKDTLDLRISESMIAKWLVKSWAKLEECVAGLWLSPDLLAISTLSLQRRCRRAGAESGEVGALSLPEWALATPAMIAVLCRWAGTLREPARSNARKCCIFWWRCPLGPRHTFGMQARACPSRGPPSTRPISGWRCTSAGAR